MAAARPASRVYLERLPRRCHAILRPACRRGAKTAVDGDDQQLLRGLTPRGAIFDFALNRFNDWEFAGACFTPDGETRFVIIRSPGMTLAIWGPWDAGVL